MTLLTVPQIIMKAKRALLLTAITSAMLVLVIKPITRAQAQETAEEVGKPRQEQKVRKFDDVLRELLNELSYDLKTNAVPEVKFVSVRRVALNESIPKSYETYLESMVVERFKKHSKIKVIQCTSCRIRRSVVADGQIHITTPINNAAELNALAEQLGIETWLDVALLYQETAMVLALNAFDAKTKELVWTKVYNSETIYRKKQAAENGEETPEEDGTAANDSAEGASAKKPKEKEKEDRFTISVTMGYHVVPNVKRTSGMLGLKLRTSERFDYGHSEVGAVLTPLVDPDLFISNYSNVEGDPTVTGEAKTQTTTESIQPFKIGASLFACYHHNFHSGNKENYDEIRPAAMGGIGIIASTGYLSLAVQGGGLIKLGKHFVVELGLLYSAPTTIRIQKAVNFKTTGGVGGDISFGLLF